ncbi:hypothetical protein O181_074350 [Austropuccinia psidii MF-1]|uniref:Integrase catalytic domain-containing protein n=1 Tax=Austropuccinia psidii MF-1 TaxID=1389203 RepID=A0A9Q3FC83_9BASI|nr:hypothetical protein [Austropuccinia psidii MF-1]
MRKNGLNQDASAHRLTAQALVTCRETPLNEMELIVDCGATHHMFNSRSCFSTLEQTSPLKVCTGDSTSSLLSEGISIVVLLCNNRNFTLENFLFVPKLNCNLISLLGICKAKLTIIQENGHFKLESNHQPLIEGKIINNLMQVQFAIPKALSTQVITNIWHQRLVHPGSQIVKSMGLPGDTSNCLTCGINKMHLIPFENQFEHVSHPLECVHIDLVGSVNPSSVSGFQYFLTIVDQATSYKTIQLLKQKCDAFEQFVIVKKEMETLHDRSLKKLVSDRGGKFLKERFKALLETQGFVHFFSLAHTPQHNGFAERANCTVLEKVRCMLNSSNFPNTYWAEAINTSTILSNLIPTPSRKNLSPYSLWKKNSPQIKKIRVFGCRAVVSIPKSHCDWKLGPVGEEGVMLGYENDNSSYRILRLSNKRILISRHVKFDKSVFPSLKQPAQLKGQSEIVWGDFPSETEMLDEIHPVIAESVDEIRSAELAVNAQEEAQERTDECLTSSNEYNEDRNEAPRTTFPFLKVIGPRHPTLVSSDIDRTNILPFGRRPKVLITSSGDCPSTYKRALTSVNKDLWELAIKKDLQSMNDLCVWDVVDLKPDYKLVGTTWVFRIKLDVKSAFLNANLTETVYLSIPQGLDFERRRYCLKLNKAIYGLKQAPLAWYKRLQKWLVNVGFASCTLDPCVFYRFGQSPTWLYIHVDDIAIFSSNASVFKKEIAGEFKIKDSGPADLILGVKISRTDLFITLDQQHFTESFLYLYGLSKCKPVLTPLLPNVHMSPATEDKIEKFKSLAVHYHSAIGSINYLSTATRPYLSQSVSALLQFLENPGIQHWNAFLHVLRYLKGTQDMGLEGLKPTVMPTGVTVSKPGAW